MNDRVSCVNELELLEQLEMQPHHNVKQWIMIKEYNQAM
jgi:hypothetical protein